MVVAETESTGSNSNPYREINSTGGGSHVDKYKR